MYAVTLLSIDGASTIGDLALNGFAQDRKVMRFLGTSLSLILMTMGYTAPSAKAKLAQEFKGKIAKS